MDYFLEVDNLGGSSQVHGFEGDFSVASFSFGTSGSPFAGLNHAGALPRGVFSDLTVTLADETGLTRFLTLVQTSANAHAVSLIGAVNTGGGGGLQEAYRVDLSNTHIVDVHQESGGGYTVDLAYQAIEVTQKDQLPDGRLSNTPQIFNYDTVSRLTGTPVANANGAGAVLNPNPTHYFLLVDGVDGGSREINHAGWFDLGDFNIDLSSQGSGAPGVLTVDLSGKDGLTSLLKNAVATTPLTGLRIEGTINTGGAHPAVVYKLELGDVHVTDLHETDAAGFQASFDYDNARLTTTNVNLSTGAVTSTNNVFSWDYGGSSGSGFGSISPGSNGGGATPTRYYLEVDNLGGSSLAHGFEGDFSVASFSFGTSGSPFAGLNHAGALPRGVFSDLTVTLADETGLTRFLTLVQTSANAHAVSLIGAVNTDGGGGLQEAYRVDLSDAHVVDVHQESGGGYTVDLTYQAIEVTQKDQLPDGRLSTTQPIFAYDTVTQVTGTPVANANGAGAVLNPNPSHYYLLVDGIDGGSREVNHVGWFDLGDFNIDLSSHGSGDPGVLTVDLSGKDGLAGLLKNSVATTPLTGLRIEGAVDTGGAHPAVVYKLELGDVHVTDLHETDAAGFQVSFDYDKARITTTNVNLATGVPTSTSNVFSWDYGGGSGFDPISPRSNGGGATPAQYYLEVDNLGGSSQVHGFEGDFNVTSFSFGTSGSPFAALNHAGALPPGVFSDLTVTLADETGLTRFLTLVQTGLNAHTVSLIGAVSTGGGAALQEAYRVDLSNTHIVDVHQESGGGYTVDLTYQAIEVTQKDQLPDGRLSNTPQIFNYDTLNHVTGTPVANANGAGAVLNPNPNHYYLLVDGVDGGSREINHAGWFDLGDFNIDLTSHGSGAPGVLTVDLPGKDGLTDLLKNAVATTPLESLRIEGTINSGGAHPPVVYKLVLGDVHVTDLRVTDADSYQVSFDYDSAQLTTTNVNLSTGAPTSTTNVFTWDYGADSPNHAPVATAASAATAEDTALQGTVTGTDLDADALTFAVGAGPAHGTLSLASNGAYTYTPTLNYNGTDSFTFTTNDGHVTSGAATVSLTVTPVNDAPAANAATATVAEDAVLTGTVAGTDVDVPTTLTFAVETGPTHGTLSLGPDGAYTYTPTHDFNGTDSFTFTTSDGTATSAPATVSLTVSPVNDAPSAVADAGSVNEKASVTLDVLANDTDVDAGDAKTLVSVSATSGGGHVAIVGGQAVYTADADSFDLLIPGQSATDSFTYIMRDQAGATSSATVTLTINGIANGAPQTGGTGDDSLSGAGLDEKLDGAAGNDTLDGGGGSDTLVGGAGNDMMLGGTGVDSLSAGDGNDTLIGGAGNDLLSGSRGNDLFVFGPSFGHDTLIDFTPGGDHIQFQGVGFASFADVQAHAVQSGANVIITDAAGDTVQLNNVQLSALHAADFLFS